MPARLQMRSPAFYSETAGCSFKARLRETTSQASQAPAHCPPDSPRWGPEPFGTVTPLITSSALRNIVGEGTGSRSPLVLDFGCSIHLGSF